MDEMAQLNAHEIMKIPEYPPMTSFSGEMNCVGVERKYFIGTLKSVFSHKYRYSANGHITVRRYI